MKERKELLEEILECLINYDQTYTNEFEEAKKKLAIVEGSLRANREQIIYTRSLIHREKQREGQE